jgi:sugar lactone lactonase YvrE/ketosteroid isomerase-like protein
MGPDGLIADSDGSFDAADYARQIEAGASGKAQAGYTLFPADRSLTHAEDGVVLPDGRLLVGDWDHGLVTLDPDGTKRPFGDFAAAGFRTRPDPLWNSPNGISWEPDGRHVLVADITGGHIYRVDTRTQAVARIYDHPFGVNAAVRDPSGAIWFTQSTENAAGEASEARMFAAADGPLGDGSVWRIAADEVGKADPQAVRVVEGLDFANGIVFDAPRGRLYVNEIVASRILSFAVDPVSGALSDRRVLATLPTPDNIELDANGDLWVASPFANAVYKVDPDTGDRRTMFAPTPEASARTVAETYRRLEAGEPLLPLLGPDIWGPMPGLVTGVILAPDGTVYVSGLGSALVKLDAEGARPAPPAAEAATRQIQSTIDTVYAAISGPAGAPRDWEAFRRVFSEDARLFAITGEGLRGGSVEDYIAASSDALVAYGFSETELVNRIEVYGKLAQAWSSYEGHFVRDGKPGAVRGINSFQLRQHGDGSWRVHSLLWQQETPEFPLPGDMANAARPPADPAGEADLMPILDNRTRVIIEGIRSGEVSGIMALYAPGSLYAADSATLLSEPATIRQFWVNVAASPAHDANLEVLRIERFGPDAFVEIQKYDVFDEEGARLFGGYASLLWRKVGGRWIIAADVSN